jgi:HSP20 family molecular chaperone IbpA
LSLPDLESFSPPGLEPAENYVVLDSAPLSKQSRLMERVRFSANKDRYIAVLRIPESLRDRISIRISRQRAVVSIAGSATHRQQGNVVFLMREQQPHQEQVHLSFTDPIASSGHRAIFQQGLLTMRFEKEAVSEDWSKPLLVD